MRKLSLILAVCLVLSAAVWSPAAIAEDITLSFWCSALYTPEETKKPQEEWMISKLVAQFEAENPGVKIDLTITTPDPETFAKFKAAAVSKSGPDIINLWSGTYLFDLADVLLPLNGYIPAGDREAITAWNAVSMNFDPNGNILAYPVGINYGVMLYNKALIKAAGLDFDAAPPKTTDELTAALVKIKETGVVPLVVDAQSGSLIMHASGYWWAQMTGYDNLIKLGSGEMNYADDPGLQAMVDYCAALYAEGLINKDAATSDDATARFLNGEAALRTGGTWDIGDTQAALGEGNFGILALPSFSGAAEPKVTASVLGGAGDCTAVAGYTKHPEMAAKFVSFLNSKASTIEICKNMGCFPARKDVTFEDLGWSDPLHEQMVQLSQSTAFWIDNSLPAGDIGVLLRFFPNALVGKMTSAELAAEIDAGA
jgi:raffinose/stachyose/melibiose transport system substrate-binding protein